MKNGQKKEKNTASKYFVFSREKYNSPVSDDSNWYFHGEFSTKEEAEKNMEIAEAEVAYEHIIVKGKQLRADNYPLITTRYLIDEN